MKEEVESVLSADFNYRRYRKEVKGRSPCVPYLGVCLSDLVFLDEANPDVMEEDQLESRLPVVHFEKQMHVAHIIAEVLLAQSVPFCFTPVRRIQGMIQEMQCETEKELYQVSLEREPRT